jgi:hypothetical protein
MCVIITSVTCSGPIESRASARPGCSKIGGVVRLYGLGPIEAGIDQDDPSVGCLEDPEHHGEVALPLKVGTLDQE